MPKIFSEVYAQVLKYFLKTLYFLREKFESTFAYLDSLNDWI